MENWKSYLINTESRCDTAPSSAPDLTGTCSCILGLFPDTEEVGEGAEGARSRRHCCSYSREQERSRRHQVRSLFDLFAWTVPVLEKE